MTNGGAPVGPEDRRRLFERFYRGHTGHRTDGFGLGLPLVREICEVLGGTVELTPEEPRTVFGVTLPAASPGAPGAGTGTAAVTPATMTSRRHDAR